MFNLNLYDKLSYPRILSDLLEERRIDDVMIHTFFASFSYKTNRFHVAVGL